MTMEYAYFGDGWVRRPGPTKRWKPVPVDDTGEPMVPVDVVIARIALIERKLQVRAGTVPGVSGEVIVNEIQEGDWNDEDV